MATQRFSVKKMDGVRVLAVVDGVVKGHYRPTGYGCFDNVRGEFVVFTTKGDGWDRYYFMEEDR